MKAKMVLVEFPDSGKKVYVKPVSLSALTMRFQRRIPKPKPPMVKVNYRDGRGDIFEANYADPDYATNMKLWQAHVIQMATDEAFRRAANFKLTEEQQAELDAWKAENPDAFDEQDSDAELWLEEIALSSEDDFMVWANFIQSSGDPQQEVVESTAEGFQG